MPRRKSAQPVGDAIPHVAYEYALLVSSGSELLGKSRVLGCPLPSPLNTHVQDAFLLHCRKLGEFFLNQPKGRYIRADHFIVPALARALSSQLPAWRHWRAAIEYQLAHLSFDRVTKRKPWDGTANKPLLQEFRTVFGKFLDALSDEHRAAFERELRKRSQSLSLPLP